MSYTQYYPQSQLLHASLLHIMGTRADILLLGKEEGELLPCKEAIEQELKRLHAMLNIFDPHSELARLNATSFQEAVYPSEELFDIIQDAANYAAQTGKLFDITLSHIANLVLDSQKKSIQLLRDDMHIDLGGYAKGLALQHINHLLQEHDIHQAFISLGDSSILALGHHPHGDYWPVKITHPQDRTQSLGQLKMRDCYASISGNTPANQGHIFDPIQKKAVQRARLTAILSPDPIVAEVLSTSLMIAEEAQFDSLCAAFPVIEKQIYEI